jgi:2-polyprenyl-6-methoxyphenol hydroxylase-like FAD-dependent oxidoreductase
VVALAIGSHDAARMATDRASFAEPDLPVVIVGAGPVGLALAIGLDRHGVRSVVLERGTSPSEHSKAAVVHLRTREVLRQWGLEAPFLDAGTLRSSLTLHAAGDGRPRLTLDLTELSAEAEAPGLLLLEQSVTERLLLDELGSSEFAEVRFGAELTDLTRHRDGVVATFGTDDGEQRLDARFLVGCDGASSSVRRLLGLPFRGLTYRVRPMLADVRIDDARDGLPWPRQHQGPDGVTNAVRLRPGLWRIIRLDDHAPHAAGDDVEVRVDDLEVARRVDEALGPGPFEVVWAERFRIHRRASPRFRLGRVVLAGDAAHIHSPLGGLGMNAGVQDAHNLAWKLTAALRGGDVDRLLGSYDVERRAVVVEQVSRTTDLATRVFLQSPPAIREHGVGALAVALRLDHLRQRTLRTLSMIDLAYPASPLLDTKHRSAGVRLPDPVLVAPDGTKVRLHRLLPAAAATLIEVSTRPPSSRADASSVARAASRSWGRDGVPTVERLRIGPGGHLDPGGTVGRLLDGDDGWILVRPDVHVAWAHTGPKPPDGAWIAWSLGARDGTPHPRPHGRARRDPAAVARRLIDRTGLDLPHYR